jgi:hypothetical protein
MISMTTEGAEGLATETKISLTHREGNDSNDGKSEKHVTHYGAELSVHADRQERIADVLCTNYSTHSALNPKQNVFQWR